VNLAKEAPVGDAPAESLTFEQALAELERIVRDLEDGETGLDQALARYEQGVGLLRHCYARLEEAEQRILLLTGQDEEGRPVTRLFEHAATLQAVRPEGKRRRKPQGDGEA
jgi:exodeoxyribonuclease VII small subunit